MPKMKKTPNEENWHESFEEYGEYLDWVAMKEEAEDAEADF